MFTQAILSVDLFSLPFQFNLSDDKKHKKTLFGGWISLLIICLSIAYLSYLCNLHFGNKLQPTISLHSKKLNEKMKLNLYENNISFKIQLSNGQDLGDLEKNGTIYLQALAVYTETDQNGQETSKIIPTKPCTDKDQNGYYCLDLQTFKGSDYISLNYFPDEFEKERLQLLLLKCEKVYLTNGQSCASDEDFKNNDVLQINTQVFVKILTYQYSPDKRDYEKKVKQERFYLSEGLVQFSRLYFQRTTSKLSSGFIIQSTQERNYISDYTRIDTTNMPEFLKKTYKLDLIAVCQFIVSDSETEQNIQYPQFTYILAQFTSVFNFMLIAGAFCKAFSQTEIVQDFVELQLKVLYKQTTIELMAKFEKQKSKIQKYEQSRLGLFSLYQKVQAMKINNLKTKQFNINPYLKQIQIICNLVLIFMNILYKRLKEDIQKFFKACFQKCLCRCFYKKKSVQNESKEVQIFKTILNESNQKELIKIKMILRMMLSVEQYSAIQLCGLNMNIKGQNNQDNQLDKSLHKEETILIKEGEIIQIMTEKSQAKIKSHVNQNENENINEKVLSGEKIESKQQELENLLCPQQNHLDKIDLLERDQNYFQECLERYFTNNQFKSELDQRILGSMIGTAEQKLNDIKNMQNITKEDKPK